MAERHSTAANDVSNNKTKAPAGEPGLQKIFVKVD